ncbi:MAG: hypothetical protein AAGD05_02130 [Bacteroidota bacterium]
MKQLIPFSPLALLLSFLFYHCTSPNAVSELYKRYNQFPHSDIRVTFRHGPNNAQSSSYFSKLSQLEDKDWWLSVGDEKIGIFKNKANWLNNDPAELFGQFADIKITNQEQLLLDEKYYVPKKVELSNQKDSLQHTVLSRTGILRWVKDSLNTNPIDIQVIPISLVHLDANNRKKKKAIHYFSTEDDGMYQFKTDELKNIPRNTVLDITLQRYNIQQVAIPNGQVVIETINSNGDYFRLID